MEGVGDASLCKGNFVALMWAMAPEKNHKKVIIMSKMKCNRYTKIPVSQ